MGYSIPKAAFAAAKKAREGISDAATKKGDIALTGKTRKIVLTSALAAMSDKELAELAKLNDQEMHAFLASIQSHAGCLLAPPTEYVGIVKETVGFKNAAPSMPGPAHIRKAIERLTAVKQEKTSKASGSADKATAKTPKKVATGATNAKTSKAGKAKKPPAKRKPAKRKAEAAAPSA